MVLLATTNPHKILELAEFLGNISWREIDPAWHVEETENSLIGNAILKANSARCFAGAEDTTLGEDTGLFVGVLGGAPGVLSARWAGAGVSFDKNIEKLLAQMKGIENSKRKATFITVACAAYPNNKIMAGCGRLEGEILPLPQGRGGFGYDPIFYYPPLKKTLAELSLEEKNKISHRGKAVSSLLPYLLGGAGIEKFSNK